MKRSKGKQLLFALSALPRLVLQMEAVKRSLFSQ